MNLNQFNNISCYEEFEIQSVLLGVSKIDILKEIGYNVDDYYFFVSNDGIFNWFDLNGNHVEDPCILKEIKEDYISKNITKCVIPNGVTSIGYSAFCNCESLISVNIPNNVTSIGDGVFYDCISLKEITIPNGVTSIGISAFRWCISLTKIMIPDSVTTINNGAFWRCESLETITIPTSVTSIGNEVFFWCRSLASITIPDSVRTIGHWAFSNCISLKEVIFKGKPLDEVKRMDNYPFGIRDKSIIKCEM